MSRLQLDLQNPINWSHPLNIGRMAWWYQPPDSGWVPAAYDLSISTALSLRDLCRRFDGTITSGASFIPTLGSLPTGELCLQWSAGGSTDGQVDLGGAAAFALTDNFTVGCTFITDTLAPTGTGGLAGLLNKYNSPGANEWSFRQHDQALEFGGSTLTATGNILAVNTLYRAIAVMRNGTGFIYVNGVSQSLSGTAAFSAGSNTVYLGESYEPGGACFRGRIGDAFISSRPWSDGDVMMDFQVSRQGYRVHNSPLRFRTTAIFPANTVEVASLSSTAYASQTLQYASPASFTATLEATATAGGIGPLVPTGTPEFLAEAVASNTVQGGVPTLVSLGSNAIASETMTAEDAARLESIAYAHNTIRSIPNGNQKILASKIYRR